MLFDVESFCDSISLTLVARAGLKLAHTPVLLALALLTYAGVRFLTVGCSGFSEGIVIGDGVAAGCAQGNQAARLALYDIQQNSHELRPSTTTAQWVDDLHSARKLRLVRWSAKRLWRRCSWCRTHKGTNWRLLPSQWSLQPHRLSPNRLFYPLQDMTYTSRKPAKPRIWGWCVQRKKADATYHGQEMGQGGKTNEKVCEVRKWTSKQATARPWRTGACAQKAFGTAAMGAPPSWVKQARTRAAEAAQCGG